MNFICFCITSYDIPDPYLNTDAGTMSPFEHGEVFVLDDGGEVFLWEAFLVFLILLSASS